MIHSEDLNEATAFQSDDVASKSPKLNSIDFISTNSNEEPVSFQSTGGMAHMNIHSTR